MQKFDYRAKNKQGKTVVGIVEAASEKNAAKILQGKDLLVISIRLKKEGLFNQIKLSSGKVKIGDLVNFTRQLSTMVNAGLQITTALEILEGQSSPAMTKIISDILHEIESGSSLSKALAKHGDVFDRIFVSLVEAGEAAGMLDKVLERLANNLENKREFQGKVKGAMVYPAIITGGMIIVGAIMIIFVVPKMTAIYQDFQADLPMSTKILIGISNFATKAWPVVLAMIGGLIYGGRIALKNPAARDILDRIYFRLPIFGKLRKQIMLTDFSRTLGLLVGSGVLVVEALEIVQNALSSLMYRKAIENSINKVKKGFSLAMALAEEEIFPPILPKMIAVGEETGKIDEVLGKVATYFEGESDRAVKALTTAMEPLIMIILGLGVGFLVVAIIMPIYSLTSQF
ncbi:MAG: type II secretion system F family protein [Patescibacteria group bacterium]|nr:type II secretion system F family protein [Patescibacteria group bacterium]